MNMQLPRNARQQAGFTLIELIVVIVILGILAATALPKFADLSGDARYATMKAAKGSMESVSAMVHARALTSGTESGTITMEGTAVAYALGYPTATTAFTTAAGLNAADFDVTGTTALTVKPKGSTKTTCTLVYTPPSGTGLAPTIVLTGSATDC